MSQEQRGADLTDLEAIKAKLAYFPLTGHFEWKESGEEAGSEESTGYVRITVCGKRYYAHRLAWLYMTGSPPPRQVDHKNKVRTDNRWSNLRNASKSQNAMNRSGGKPNKLGVKGVSQKPCGLYRAAVTLKGKTTEKLFSDLEAARVWATETREKLHGKFSDHECKR